jgi:glycosyltransferase involved in cell wall biosynthesis
MTASGPKIALFYFVVVKDNAIGMVDRIILERLCEKYEFTVFANKFDNPRPDRIRWVRVPCLLSPAVLSVISFRVVGTALLLWHRLVRGNKFVAVQASDACIGNATISDAHFCNRFYLSKVMDRKIDSVRSAAALANRVLCSYLERRVYRKVSLLVVPSQGLRRELVDLHGISADKIRLVRLPNDPNMWPPDQEERTSARERLLLAPADIVFIFAALGDFGRKGLGPLIEAFTDARLHNAKLLVVGGSSGLIESFRNQATALGLERNVVFCGRHPSIREFLWAADAFILPSRYEVYPVVAMQAALTALPLITTALNGVEEYAVEGVTGFSIERPAPDCIADAVAKFLALPEGERRNMGRAARNAIEGQSVERFAEAWEDIYTDHLAAAPNTRSVRKSVLQQDL